MSTPNLHRTFSRRQLLRAGVGTSAMIAFDRTAPSVLCQAAEASATDQKILVVVEMAGGNDALNTVVPHSHDAYKKARPKLGIPKATTLSITKDIGLHPSMIGMAELLEDNKFSIVHGVGYENPNRSHFESMDIWHSCKRKTATRHDGWLGRYLESQGQTDDPMALHLGGEKQPFALMSREVRVPSIQSLDQFRLKENGSVDLSQAIQSIANQPGAANAVENDLLDFIQSSTSSAITTSQRMEATRKSKSSSSTYPQSGLGKKLETVSKLIASKLQTRIYYVRIDGFDTHANQPDAHAALLREVSESVTAFVRDMEKRGDGDRVLVMCFSEFGRRVAENASDGTDHGTAAPVFFAGNKIKSGEIGQMPSLTDLDQGDLKFHTDFRCVYATVLEQWLDCPSESILGKKYNQIKLFA